MILTQAKMVGVEVCHWRFVNCSACYCRFQCILEYVEKPLSKFTADMGAVLATAPCSRLIFQMSLDPPEQPPAFPAQAELLNTVKHIPHQRFGPKLDEPTTQNQQNARHGSNLQCRAAALAGPQHRMQHQTAGVASCTIRMVTGYLT